MVSATTTKAAGPTWRPADPDEQPPQRLIEAKVGHDRQQIEIVLDHLQIHDPAQRVMMREAMMANRSYDARRIVDDSRPDEAPTCTLECGIWQGRALMNNAESDPFMRRHDMFKPLRTVLNAVEAFAAGSPAALRALCDETPNKTHAALRWDALTRATLAYCVHRLHFGSGGFKVTPAAREVAKHATAQGLSRTHLTVRKIYYAVAVTGTDTEAAEFYADIVAASPVGSAASEAERLAWLRQASLARLADTGEGGEKRYPIPVTR